MAEEDTDKGKPETEAGTKLDAMIIGAGVAGLYQLYLLRNQGLDVRAYDTRVECRRHLVLEPLSRAPASTPRPTSTSTSSRKSSTRAGAGARSFPASRRSSAGCTMSPTVSIFGRTSSSTPRITSAHYDEAAGRWTVRTDTRRDASTRSSWSPAAACSPAPLSNLFPGQDTFEGQIVHTARWPKEPVDLAGKRVGVVGIGATGIQVIQTIATEVGHLKVFVRTPQYVLPMKNPKYGPADAAAYKARFDELRNTLPHTFTGFEYDFEHRWADLTPEQRREVLEEIYERRLAEAVARLVRRDVLRRGGERGGLRVRAREDARAAARTRRLCELLIPTDYGFGTHRVPLETNYLEVYHRPNVEVVGVRDNPIERVVAGGHPDRRRHGPRARRHHPGDRLRRRDGGADPHRHPRPRAAGRSRRTGAGTSAPPWASRCTATRTCSRPRCRSPPRRRCAT